MRKQECCPICHLYKSSSRLHHQKMLVHYPHSGLHATERCPASPSIPSLKATPNCWDVSRTTLNGGAIISTQSDTQNWYMLLSVWSPDYCSRAMFNIQARNRRAIVFKSKWVACLLELGFREPSTNHEQCPPNAWTLQGCQNGCSQQTYLWPTQQHKGGKQAEKSQLVLNNLL